ncbi:MAG: hypothetical protein AAFQ80_09465 [Cyanobacteria bacterium J06621_8]
MNEQEREQNQKINRLTRKLAAIETRLKTLELDIEPQGRISSAFEAVEEDLDQIKSDIIKFQQNVEHRFNRLDTKLEVIIEHLILNPV